MKKTSISSVVCLDIIDFAKKSKQEQQANKKRLDDLVAQAVIDIPENDRMIVDTGHGVVITCSGPLENALEDALFIALTIRDEILNTNTEMEYPLYLLMGINLGSVKVENSVNINEPPKIIGEGLIEAQRIMSFANPNQILVSRAYYEMASKLTLEIAQMFEKYDMHAYEHDIYAVRLLNEKATSLDNAAPFTHNKAIEDEEATESKSVNWRNYLLPIILAIIMLFALTKWMNAEKGADNEAQPASTDTSLDQAAPAALEDDTSFDLIKDETDTPETSDDAQDKDTQQKLEEVDKPVQKSTVKKTSTKKATSAPKSESDTINIVTEESKVTESKPEENSEPPAQTTKDEEKSTWEKFKESVKQGADKECSQAQRALNQCN